MKSLKIIAFLVTIFCATEVRALKCWRCSSDATGSEFCNDPFDETIIGSLQRSDAYQDCSIPPGNPLIVSPSARPVCKKLKQLVHDKIVVSRSCFWEDINQPSDRCMEVITPPYVRTEFCETCDSFDGCNGSSTFGPAIALLTMSAIARYL